MGELKGIEQIEKLKLLSEERFKQLYQYDLHVRIICNEDFKSKILGPVVDILDDVADTSELFMRSLQMYNLFADKRTRFTGMPRKPKIDDNRTESIEKMTGTDNFNEMKIGAIVRTELRKLLEDGMVSEEEMQLMQTKEYSKETFDIQYPLLMPSEGTNGMHPARYYSAPITVHRKKYFLCSEWFEVPTNNDGPYLLKWLALHSER